MSIFIFLLVLALSLAPVAALADEATCNTVGHYSTLAGEHEQNSGEYNHEVS